MVGRTLAGLLIMVNVTGGRLVRVSLSLPPLEILLLYEVRKTRPQGRLPFDNISNVLQREIMSVLVLPSLRLHRCLLLALLGPNGLPA